MSDYPILEIDNTINAEGIFRLESIQRILNTKHPTHSPFNFHQIEFFAFILYTEGKEIHTIDFTDYQCKKGTLLAIRKGQIHKFSDQISKGHILVFNYSFLSSFFIEKEAQKSLLLFNEFIYKPNIQLNYEAYKILIKLIHQIKEELANSKDSFSYSIIRSLLQVFINQVFRIKTTNKSEDSNKKYLSDFIEFQNLIEKGYTQTLKVKDYAKKMDLSTKTLNAVTKSIVNKTAKAFIDEICIKNIKRVLINTDNSVKEISYQMGFEETTNFNNYFKKRVGKTPAEFRKM